MDGSVLDIGSGTREVSGRTCKSESKADDGGTGGSRERSKTVGVPWEGDPLSESWVGGDGCGEGAGGGAEGESGDLVGGGD